MNRDEIYAKVTEVLEDALGVDEDEVQPTATLTSDLGAESIDFLDIVFRLEKAFDIKIAQGELFPENVQQNPEYVEDGKITDKGLAELKEKMPHADFTKLESDRDVDNVGEIFTVDAIVKFVEAKLASWCLRVWCGKGMLLMRWIWIDRIIELERGKHVLAVKNVSLAEEVVHDHFPAQETAAGEPLEPLPVMPASLLIEGMAQTAGILVGHLNDFKEKVILAKITKARFDLDVLPGQTVFFDATIERIDRSGASTKGEITVLEHVTGTTSTVGVVELIFSHIDQNRAGVEFPEHNFVFTDNFKTLLITSNITWCSLLKCGSPKTSWY